MQSDKEKPKEKSQEGTASGGGQTLADMIMAKFAAGEIEYRDNTKGDGDE